MVEILTMPRDEASKRVAALAQGITQVVADSGELVDLSLDALLSSYLTIAEQTGRLQEVPTLLLNLSEALSKSLKASHSPHIH